MNKDLTEIVLIIDKSGSMNHLTNDVIGGINQFISDQKELPGNVNLSMILFDDTLDHKYNRIDLKVIPNLDSTIYKTGGMTSLYDAIGYSVNYIGDALDKTTEADKPSKILVAIMTDGDDNRSIKYTAASIKEIIDHQITKYAWEFIFMAANIDVKKTADSIGISNSLAFTADSSGTRSVYACFSDQTTSYRSSK
jgi:uncharacterized protein YegL